METLGGCEEPERLRGLIQTYWEKYQYYDVKEPMLQANKKIKSVDLSNDKKYLGNSSIGPEGCKHLSRVQWPVLQSLNLSNCI